MESYYTYELNRECPNCSTPIPDQEHALRKFCERVQLDDGTILSCKDDYNSAKRKQEKAPFKGFAPHHEKMRNGLRNLFRRHGETVNIELINRYGIILNRPAEIEWKNDGSIILYFVSLAVIKTTQNQYKIIKHDRIF